MSHLIPNGVHSPPLARLMRADRRIQDGGDLLDHLVIDRRRATALAVPTFRRGQPRYDPLTRQGAPILHDRAKEREEQCAMRPGRIHLFGQ